MSKVIVFSDLQAHTHQKYAKRTGFGINSRLEVALDCLHSIWEYATDHGIGDVFFAGDMFETKNRIPVTVLNAVMEELQSWVKSGFAVLMIPGNHDHSVKSGDVHALKVISVLDGFQTIDQAMTTNYALKTGEIILVTAMPFRETMPDFRTVNPSKESLRRGKRMLEELSGKPVEATRHVLLAHGSMESFCPLPFKAPADPYEPSGDWIRKAWVAPLDHAFIGHIHQPGKKTIEGCPVVLPGCPYQENASAKGEARGFYVWDTETNESEFVEAVDGPRFFDCVVPVMGDFQAPDHSEGNIALLRPENDTVSPDSVRKARKSLYTKGAAFVETLPPVSFLKVPEASIRASSDASKGPMAVLHNVVKEGMVNMRGIGKRSVYDVAREVIDAVGISSRESLGTVQLTEVMGWNMFCFGDISVRLDNQGLIGVGGVNLDTSHANSNGTGKSSLVDLVSYALFGKALRDIPVDGVINKASASCRAMIRFQDSVGKEYEIFRSRKDKAFGSALHFHQVWCGHDLDTYQPAPVESDLRGEDNKETQLKIESILGMTFNMFRSLVVLGQGGASRFSKLKDSEKKTLLGEIMGVSYYVDLSKKARTMGSKPRGQNLQELSIHLEHSKQSRANRLENISKQRANQKEWNANQEEHLNRISQDIASSAAKVALLKMESDELVVVEARDKGDLQDEIQRYTEEITRSVDSITRCDDEYGKKYRDLQGKISTNMGLDVRHQDNKDRLLQVQESGECPTCGQESGESVSSAIHEELNKIDEVRKARHALNLELEEMQDARSKDIETLASEGAHLRAQRDELRMELAAFDSKFALVRARKQAWLDEVARYDKLVEYQKKEEQASDVWTPALLGLEAQLKENSKEIESKERLLMSLTEYQQACTVVADAFGPKGARSLLFDSMIPVINEMLSRYSESICGRYLEVQLSMTTESAGKKAPKEELDLRVRTPEGPSSFGACSGGEQRRMDIPILLALQEIASSQGVGLGVCFLDEAFENMDLSGKEGLFALLDEIAESSCTSSIFVVTHDEEAFSTFEKNITFTKQNGISEIGR